MAFYAGKCKFATEMAKNRILVVDDEQDLCEILHFNLTSAGFEAETAFSAEEAFMKIRSNKPYDLLLLDVMMPGLSGFELAAVLKRDEKMARIPIIFLTAKDKEEDTLKGFDLGADDYITKPFSVREVMARVKAVLHRSLPSPLRIEEVIHYRELTVDSMKKIATINGEYVPLTKTEFELLCLLMSNRNQVLSRQQLLDGAWPQDVIVTDRTVDVNITRMRKKLGRYASNIIARQGFGYCFVTPPEGI